jgi:hypothetical protein
MFIETVNSHDWVDWFAKNGGNMPDLHWHLYVYVERIFNLLADFLKNFGNVSIVTGGRPISELDTRSLTKALTVMKTFITQVDLAQSTNAPIVVCRGNIYKYKVNPINSAPFPAIALVLTIPRLTVPLAPSRLKILVVVMLLSMTLP